MAYPGPHSKSMSKPVVSTKPPDNEPPYRSVTPVAHYALHALGYARIGLGAASLLFPHFTCGLFKFAICNETATVVRLFAVRGIALGELLITADNKTPLDGGKRELSRTLWANVGCDMVDICSLGFAVVSGHIDRLPGALLSGGAAVCVALGLLGLNGI